LEQEEADALVARAARGSGEQPVAVAVRVADCVPILLGDRDTGDVAAVHAGWRGVEARILAATIATLGARPGALVAAVGPCIGPCCFEVGEDVAERIANASAPEVIVRRAAPKAFVDLRAAVRTQLRALGVEADAIDDVGQCTRCNEADFHSFRRDGEASGRLIAAIVASAVVG
jgi:YfiH family protein